MTTIEVWADVTCPFAHVGLQMVASQLAALDHPIEIVVRAWPLEWVNGAPLAADAVARNVNALERQLGVDCFRGFRADRWPVSSIPALNLADAAYRRDATTGFEMSKRLRSLLFEEGQDIADDAVLREVADAYGLATAPPTVAPGVLTDYSEGQRRGVRGSPEFLVGDEHFFCPALELGHDDDGNLTAGIDRDGIARFVRTVASRT